MIVKVCPFHDAACNELPANVRCGECKPVKDSQPKPASVEYLKDLLEVKRIADLSHKIDREKVCGRVVIQHFEAITQQAEALARAQELLESASPRMTELEHKLAQALAEVELHRRVVHRLQDERDELRAQLAAFQYDGELPEPIGYLAWRNGKPCWDGDDCIAADAIYPADETDDRESKAIFAADQVRQAIANDRAKRVDHLQDIAAFIGVGGYNGATTEQLVERITSEFQRIADDRAKQVPQGWKRVPETPTNGMTVAMANALEDPENERSSWDLAENMYAAMLAAAPDPKEAL